MQSEYSQGKYELLLQCPYHILKKTNEREVGFANASNGSFIIRMSDMKTELFVAKKFLQYSKINPKLPINKIAKKKKGEGALFSTI